MENILRDSSTWQFNTQHSICSLIPDSSHNRIVINKGSRWDNSINTIAKTPVKTDGGGELQHIEIQD
jgi:hypothetical protein